MYKVPLALQPPRTPAPYAYTTLVHPLAKSESACVYITLTFIIFKCDI